MGKVVVYVENPDKTTNPEFYDNGDMTERECQGLEDVIAYAVNSRKTEQHKKDSDVLERFVSGVNCHPATARAEMLSVKKRFGKEDGTIAYHGYQSFAPGEATPEMAHKIGVELAQRLWGDRYQVVVATHLDKANHLHNHFVLNTVSFVDGIKYHRTAKDYHEMQTVSDDLCREYGLSVIENPQPGKSKHYGEWRAEQEQRPTWRGIVRADIDEVIRQSMTERQFFENLHRKGYKVKVHRIDTAEQLSSYQSELESRIADVTSQRRQLYRKQRTAAVKSDEVASAEVSTAIATLSKELSQLRREVKLCSDIAVRSGILPERIQEIQKSQRKEQNEHDQFRRCGRANR